MLRLLGVILFDVCTAVWYRSSLTWGLMRVHKYEYLHLSTRIRKCVSLDADVYVHLCFSDCAKPWHVLPFKLASSHLYVCMCTLKTFATELLQTRTDTAMTFDTFKEVAEFRGGTLFWFPTTVFFLHRFIFRGTDLECSEYMYWVCAYCTSCARC